MGSGEYRLYCDKNGNDHPTWPAPPPPPSDSLPRLPLEEEHEAVHRDETHSADRG
jgi:hypothetical protein